MSPARLGAWCTPRAKTSSQYEIQYEIPNVIQQYVNVIQQYVYEEAL
ncbi:hypothetical protein NGF19_04830 [Streptomyces sp. RY43-2]|uniref:Uncharacterized protein n=1 Tax=Streptomyces macrolidinus TaxID=2952607 RepID=A0ABT0ZBD1_9ACTN|nr:hypothetical protein [Streptomyces macrolidinus]MCN9240121.1 hypothetical protein [Streptomyces macrolidinus]